LKPIPEAPIQAIDPNRPQPDLIQSAKQILADGGVVVYPTRCIYGLGGDALNAASVQRIFAIKQRDLRKPLLILVPGVDDVATLVEHIPATAVALMERFWPGRITIVFKAAAHLPPGLTAGTAKIGIRVPGHPVARALVSAFARPVTGTSANLSGRPGCRRIDQLPPTLLARIDLVLDAGPLEGGVGSTVVDVTADVPVILREGSVPRSEIERLMHVR
jgi:L-threonylcarbamoyladenylate synthase